MRNNPTPEVDPLVRAVDRLWKEQLRLLPRWVALRRATARSAYEEGELRVLEARVLAVRALSRRFCTILRDEAWARYELRARGEDPPAPVALPRPVRLADPALGESEQA